LEYSTADFAVAAFARATCQVDATTRRLLARSSSWRNVFDPASGYVEPRSVTGAFSPTFSPTSGDGFVEGDAAQYTWHVLHDPAGLVAALGGRARAAARLDAFFARLNAGPASPYAFLGNEPTLHTPYLYDWVGRPWAAARVVRAAMRSLYGPGPGGLPGNDDLGTMSAWWVFGALGIYPSVPGTDVLALGAPAFPHVVVHLPGGDVRIDAPGARSLPYVAALRVDGRPHGVAWLRGAALARGAHLTYLMSARPSRWATSPAAAPPSGSAAVAAPGSCA
jgi:predicted alpha-1,2-mannosidase